MRWRRRTMLRLAAATGGAVLVLRWLASPASRSRSASTLLEDVAERHRLDDVAADCDRLGHDPDAWHLHLAAAHDNGADLAQLEQDVRRVRPDLGDVAGAARQQVQTSLIGVRAACGVDPATLTEAERHRHEAVCTRCY